MLSTHKKRQAQLQKAETLAVGGKRRRSASYPVQLKQQASRPVRVLSQEIIRTVVKQDTQCPALVSAHTGMHTNILICMQCIHTRTHTHTPIWFYVVCVYESVIYEQIQVCMEARQRSMSRVLAQSLSFEIGFLTNFSWI